MKNKQENNLKYWIAHYEDKDKEDVIIETASKSKNVCEIKTLSLLGEDFFNENENLTTSLFELVKVLD